MGADYYWFCPQTMTGVYGYKAEFLTPGPLTVDEARTAVAGFFGITRARVEEWLDELPENATVLDFCDYSAGDYMTPASDAEKMLQRCYLLDLFLDVAWGTPESPPSPHATNNTPSLLRVGDVSGWGS